MTDRASEPDVRQMGRPKRPTREEQIGGRCKHFTGTSNQCCSAGVRYVNVELTHEPFEYQGQFGATYKATKSLPCIRSHNHCGAVCEKLEFPTPEEIAAKVVREREGFAKVVKARAAIVDRLGPFKKGRSRDERGSIPCPNCEGGTLAYSRAAYNGHVWGKCSTEGCAAWME